MLARSRSAVKTRALHVAPGALCWLALAGWLGLIFYLSHQTSPPSVPGRGLGGPESGLAHVAVYAVLATLCFWALARSVRREGPLWALAAVAFALTVLYGVTDELHQAFVPGRTASQADILMDAAGALLGIGAAALAGSLGRSWRTRR